jgi:SAM-dependent methyltransferase
VGAKTSWYHIFMLDPNDDTIKTYRENFEKYASKTHSFATREFTEWMDMFLSSLPANPRVFELGSATGRDARYFRLKGAKVTCTDVVPEVVSTLSKEGFESSLFDFRDEPNPEWLGRFDGVFANAVLLHAPPEVFAVALKNIKKILDDNGVLAFSVKTGDGEEISLVKMDAPRYFKYYAQNELELILSKLGYKILEIRTAGDGKWLQVIAKK